jgi:hypothetical protein
MKQDPTIAEQTAQPATGFPSHDTVEIFIRVPRASVDLHGLTMAIDAWLEARGGGQVLCTHSRPDWDGVARSAWTDEVEGYE